MTESMPQPVSQPTPQPVSQPTPQPTPVPAPPFQSAPQPTGQPMRAPTSQIMKILVALNVVTLVAVVLLGAFSAINVADANQKIASVAASLPPGGVASSADVQAATAAAQGAEHAVADLTVQVTALNADLAAVRSQVAEIAAGAAAPSPGPTPTPDGAIAGIVSKLEELQTVVTHLQEDLAAINGLVQTVCSALGRC